MLSKFIEENNFNKENNLVSLFEAIKFDQGNWVHFLIKDIALNFNEYLNSDKNRRTILNLPIEHVKAILNRDDLFVANEDLVY